MQQFLTFCQAKIKHWRDRRFLKKHGCDSWAQYNRRFDPDYNIRASRVKDYYHGYKYWKPFENHAHQIYQWDLGYDGSKEVIEWCEKNIKGKFRFDCLRCYRQTPIGLNGAEEPDWFINDLGNGDYFFFACQDERDFLWFTMRWA